MADDLGLNDLGVTGSDYHETPNLDALAKESMIFTNAYSSAPNSAPSRACLMSGLYTPRHGVYTVNPPDRGVDSKRKYIAIANNDTLEPKFKTIAEELKDNGYKNCHIGKWHLGNIEDKTDPLNRGFDINIGGTHAGAPQSHFFPYAGEAGSAERYPGLEKGTDKEYLTDRLTDEAIRFIKNARLKKQPFFLNLSYFAVHYPIQAPEDLVEKYNNKPKGTYHKDPIYAAMTESLDTNVGRILDVIKKSGLDENTVIIFTSDNGGAEPTTDNYQVRGGKGEPVFDIGFDRVFLKHECDRRLEYILSVFLLKEDSPRFQAFCIDEIGFRVFLFKTVSVNAGCFRSPDASAENEQQTQHLIIHFYPPCMIVFGLTVSECERRLALPREDALRSAFLHSGSVVGAADQQERRKSVPAVLFDSESFQRDCQ